MLPPSPVPVSVLPTAAATNMTLATMSAGTTSMMWLGLPGNAVMRPTPIPGRRYNVAAIGATKRQHIPHIDTEGGGGGKGGGTTRKHLVTSIQGFSTTNKKQRASHPCYMWADPP